MRRPEFKRPRGGRIRKWQILTAPLVKKPRSEPLAAHRARAAGGGAGRSSESFLFLTSRPTWYSSRDQRKQQRSPRLT